MTVVKISPQHPHLSWRTEAVCDPDPKEFGRQLQQALQSLTDEGFSIVNQMFRGESVIITAQRVDGLPTQFAPTIPAPPMNRRKVVQHVVSTSESIKRTEEVVYHRHKSELEPGEGETHRHEAIPCKSLHAAVKMALSDLDLEEDGILPISITVQKTDTYEPKTWVKLFKSLARSEDTAKEN